jgi:hypothetical protein
MSDQALTPSRLWKQMTQSQRLEVAQAFWLDEEALDDQVQAALLIAQRLKFRPKTVVGLDAARKARYLANLAALPDTVAGRALVVFHLARHRAMMASFLDALGIAHEQGIIQEEHVAPDPGKVPQAVEQLAQKFPAPDVSLYLCTLLCQDPEAWRPLEGLPQAQMPASGASS